MIQRRTLLGAALAAPAILALGRAARAADEVTIGVIYPLSGNSAQIGADAHAAYDVTAEIINGQHDPLPMLMGKGGGLAGLGGARIKLVYADHANDPQKGRAEAERLITQDKVVAIIGSFSSATAATISQVCERYEIPYMSADNSSPSLSQRGLKWFFRTTPNDVNFSEAMFAFYKDVGAKTGRPVKSVSLFYEDSIFGTDSSNIQRKLAGSNGIAVAADIRYRANSPSLSAEAQRLRAAGADVLMPSSYVSDAILIMRAMNEVGYHPPAVLAQAAGFQEQSFISGAGGLAEGVLSRSSYAGDAVKARPAIAPVTALYRAKQNKDLNDNTARQVTALQILADAIDRSGSAKPGDIRDALIKTDVKGIDTIMPWTGVKFDATGQNTEGTPVIQQVHDGAYRTVWPADVAVAEPVWTVGQ